MSNVRSVQTDKVNFFGNTSPRELASRYGTPLYVYNENVLRQRCRDLTGLSDLPGFHVNYSAKANTNPALLRIVREEGCHADAMSPGELYMNKLAGFTADNLLYVCNNVSADEMRNAVENGLLVSVDSLSQLDLYGTVNPGGKVMIRINPGIGAGHHVKVITAGKETKFGIDPTSLDEVRALLAKHKLTLAGVNQHIGSLFMEPDNYLNAIDFLLHFIQSDLSDLFAGLEIIDFGGGLGIPYHKYDEQPRLDMESLGRQLHAKLTQWVGETGYKGKFFIEPGRYVVAECGVLLGTVHATKFNGPNRYVGTDLGFNVLVRPAMYDSFHDIEIYRENGQPDDELVEQSVVGNICESGDILAKKRQLPLIKEGDVLGVLDAGAYGFVMSSSYNQRPRAAEVLITSDGTPKLIRRRETVEDLAKFFVEE
ncbi:diaminopimelate decarboxylase [uncultured Bilophila sp.]|nr:diaminopimelate decarboxylase [uncultured Bilophila sp.]